MAKSLRKPKSASVSASKNPRATVSDIRYAGYPIYADTEVAGNNQRVTRYRHGTASRRLVRAGYKAMRMNLV